MTGAFVPTTLEHSVGDTVRTGACTLASYVPARPSPKARVQRQRARKHRR